jgi:hypothetical protein
VSDYVTNVKLEEIFRSLSEMKKAMEELKSNVKSDGELWDSSDIVNNWHVSTRTLADWRKKNLIAYVQINKKIYYPKKFREDFLKDNSNMKGGSIG